MSSQRTRSRQGSLQAHALSVLATALRKQFERSLGAGVLSGVRRQRSATRSPSSRGETVALRDRRIRAFAASAHAGAETLERRGRKRHGGPAPAGRGGERAGQEPSRPFLNQLRRSEDLGKLNGLCGYLRAPQDRLAGQQGPTFGLDR